jgi:large subunit ribosomal protein L29
MAEQPLSAKAIRELPDAEIQAQLEKLQQELWQSRQKVREGALQQTHTLSTLRRQIARIHTIVKEKESSAKR